MAVSMMVADVFIADAVSVHVEHAARVSNLRPCIRAGGLHTDGCLGHRTE